MIFQLMNLFMCVWSSRVPPQKGFTPQKLLMFSFRHPLLQQKYQLPSALWQGQSHVAWKWPGLSAPPYRELLSSLVCTWGICEASVPSPGGPSKGPKFFYWLSDSAIVDETLEGKGLWKLDCQRGDHWDHSKNNHKTKYSFSLISTLKSCTLT